MILLPLLLAACSAQITGNVPPWDNVSYTGPHSVLDVGAALFCFEQARVLLLDDLTITETPLDDGIAGLEKNRGAIFVAPADRLSSTALAHELEHVAQELAGEPLSEPSGRDFPIVLQVNDRLRSLGL